MCWQPPCIFRGHHGFTSSDCLLTETLFEKSGGEHLSSLRSVCQSHQQEVLRGAVSIVQVRFHNHPVQHRHVHIYRRAEKVHARARHMIGARSSDQPLIPFLSCRLGKEGLWEALRYRMRGLITCSIFLQAVECRPTCPRADPCVWVQGLVCRPQEPRVDIIQAGIARPEKHVIGNMIGEATRLSCMMQCNDSQTGGTGRGRCST